MDFPESMGIRHQIFLLDDGRRLPIPAWAKAEIWLGWWCRKWQLDNARLLTVAVLPARDLAAAFAALGCLLAGSQQFTSGLTWEDLRNLPAGSAIFWGIPNERARYEGVILENQSDYLVPVRIRKGRRRDVNAVWYFSKQRFAQYLFSQECLPTQRGMLAIGSAQSFQQGLGLKTNPRWLWTAGAEACVVTSQARFATAIDNLGLTAGDSPFSDFHDVLCMSSSNERSLAKLRITSPHKPIDLVAPVSILDGKNAFDQIREINTGNILILLDRGEYSPEIHNLLLEAQNAARHPSCEMLKDLPARFPPSVELAAFVLPDE
ncbi:MULTISPECIES: hypothetical protein [Methylocaldum]|jgi:hypothetical protein|uniref:hypothetical protein n=1 Tax=Methylocaldum sp. GT1TLB TaxID=3438965 RepID=UPI0012EC9AEB|nr:hypothetical protein [Methylocaldum sp. BRCS4]